MLIKLMTSAGEFIRDDKMPMMERAPDIIIFQNRYFRFNTSQPNKDRQMVYMYSEVVVYHLSDNKL